MVRLTPVNRVIARSYLSAPFGGHFTRPRLTALQAALAAQCDGGLILGGVFGAIRRVVFDLAGKNIADQLAELDGIAGALKALCCHPGSMPFIVGAGRHRAEFQTVPLPNSG